MSYSLRAGPLPDAMKNAAPKLDQAAAKKALAARDDAARKCAERFPKESRFGEPATPKGKAVGLWVYFHGIDGTVAEIKVRVPQVTPYSKCLEQAYGKAKVPRFQAYRERTVYTFEP